ncbi:MAG TPA: helix-turn-helix domain-containing protein [Candidatus Acidoferrum sp.]
MLREKRYSLSSAARELGINRVTLKRWLKEDMNIILPRVHRGSRVVIYERDLVRLMNKRRDAREMAGDG